MRSLLWSVAFWTLHGLQEPPPEEKKVGIVELCQTFCPSAVPHVAHPLWSSHLQQPTSLNSVRCGPNRVRLVILQFAIAWPVFPARSGFLLFEICLSSLGSTRSKPRRFFCFSPFFIASGLLQAWSCLVFRMIAFDNLWYHLLLFAAFLVPLCRWKPQTSEILSLLMRHFTSLPQMHYEKIAEASKRSKSKKIQGATYLAAQVTYTQYTQPYLLQRAAPHCPVALHEYAYGTCLLAGTDKV